MRILGLLVAALPVACRAQPDVPRAEPEPAPVAARAVHPAPDLNTSLDRIDSDGLRRHIEHLASDAMRGRPTPSSELEEAARYIAASLAEAGVDPGPEGSRRLYVPCGPAGESAANVMGILRGTGNEAVLVTAHYDHVGEATAGDDRIFNGANDNASGVAAMLELADALAHAPGPRHRTIAFIAFCGEEHGFRGSTRFVEDPSFSLDSIVAVVNLEMLGHPDPDDPRRAWVTGHDYSSLRRWLDQAGVPEDVTFVSGEAIGETEAEAFDRSDNYPFAIAGVIAHTIAVGPIDEHYHAVSDEPSRIDTTSMVPIVRAVGRAVFALANDDSRPVWSGTAPARFTRPASSTPRP